MLARRLHGVLGFVEADSARQKILGLVLGRVLDRHGRARVRYKSRMVRHLTHAWCLTGDQLGLGADHIKYGVVRVIRVKL